MKSKARNKVVLAGLPPGFVDDLPSEDQQALLDVIGKAVFLNGYDQDGRAELEFKDKQGVVHFIYLDPRFVS